MSKSRMDIYKKPDQTLTLYKVVVKNYDCYFVVCQDPTKAYEMVRKFLDDNDLCFESDRQLLKIEPMAINYYCGGYDMLMLPGI